MAATVRPVASAPRVLWCSLPIAALAMTASLVGIVSGSPYAAESANWAAQAVGQDVVNVALAYPALLVLAWLAARGSLRAHLAWLGVLAYSAYSYLLYAGFLHFSGWFLVYVAVLGLSVHALIGGLIALDPAQVAASFRPGAPLRLAARILIAMGVLFALLWLVEIVPAAIAGTPLPSAVESGLITNPVHLLDLSLFLPAMVVTGVLLLRARPLGAVLVVPLYAWGVVMGTAVIGMFVSLALAGEGVQVLPIVLMATAALVQGVVLVRLLAALAPRGGTGDRDQRTRAPEREAAGAPVA